MGEVLSWYAVELDECACNAFSPQKKDTVIYELEFLALACAMHIWKDYLRSSLVTFYSDNEARYSCIKASVEQGVLSGPLKDFLAEEMNLGVDLWFSRVTQRKTSLISLCEAWTIQC
ncbi:unnamed protein product [Symbiodinium sp. CCMP2456]|nr:unnamed protein product [Symbiodinium sp. CCMP2456]